MSLGFYYLWSKSRVFKFLAEYREYKGYQFSSSKLEIVSGSLMEDLYFFKEFK